VVGVDPDDIARRAGTLSAKVSEWSVRPRAKASSGRAASIQHPWALGRGVDRAHRRGEPAILPNLGGSLPNDVFAETLGLPTLWVPHSYAGCSQHAKRHLLASVARDA
jgi:hypothetical protein